MTSFSLWSKMGPMKAVLLLITLVHLSTAQTQNDVNIFHDKTAYSALENKIRVLVTLRLNDTYHEDIVVNVTVGELEGIEEVLKAEAGVDFSTDGFPKQMTIPAGQTSAQFEVRVINDLIVERDEQFQVSFTYTGGQPGVVVRPGFDEANITIKNDDDVNIFHERTAYRNFENKIRILVTLRLNDTYHEDIVVNVTVGELEGIEDVLKAEVGVDFSTDGFPKQVTIPAGQTSAQFEARVINDLIVERDEQFQVSFTYSGGQPGVVVRPGFDEANITILNDDALRVTLAKNLYPVREDVGNLFYRLNASKTASFPYVVIVTAVDGTAKCGLDYDTPVAMASANLRPVSKCSYSLNVVIPAGEVLGSGVVAIINDTVHEGQKEFYFHLSVSPEFRRHRILVDNPRRMRVTVQIEDDDELRVFFKPAFYFVLEGDILQIVLQTNKQFEVPFTIDVTIVEGTAVASSDYENRSYQVVLNVTTQTGTLVVHTEMDNIIENDEDFTAVLSVPAGLPRVFEGTPSEATVTILDQTAAEVYFDPATYNVTEGQPADLILRLTRDVDLSVTIIMVVQIMHGPGDCLDYTSSLLTAVFRGNSTAIVPVPTLPDYIVEGEENFAAVIIVPVDAAVAYRITRGSPATATVVIIDNDKVTVIVATVVVVLVVMTTTVAIVIAVAVFCRKRSKCRPHHPLSNPVCECDRSGKESMAPGNTTSNPSHMTAKDVVSRSFAPGTEEDKEIDHTNEVLPFEATEEGQDDTIQGGGQEATADDDRTV